MTSENDRVNPALWAMIVIPTATVIASALTLYLAVVDAEPALPERFAVEGRLVEEGFARADAARHDGIQVTLDLGESTLIFAEYVSHSDSPPPETLTLRLTHATNDEVDRVLQLRRDPIGAGYSARLSHPVPAGRWWIDLEHGSTWRLRGHATTPTRAFVLGE